VKITVERRDEFLVAVPQIFDRVKSVALWSARKKGKKRTSDLIVKRRDPFGNCRDANNHEFGGVSLRFSDP
jgi:hypothetical protein